MKNVIGAWRSSFFRGYDSWKPRLEDTKKSWSVCPHLSRPEELFDYYLGSGSIMILLGKVLCFECYEIIVSRNDLSEYINVSKHMTDHQFQNEFIEPLIEVNQEFLSGKGHDQDGRSWLCCSHVAQKGQLETLYSTCNPMFVHEGFVTCNECDEVVPTTSQYLQTLMDCVAMTDSQLQKIVIDQLYPINREVLDAVGHFSR